MADNIKKEETYDFVVDYFTEKKNSKSIFMGAWTYGGLYRV